MRHWVEIIGVIVLLALVLMIVMITLRRTLLARAGGFDVSWRRHLTESDRGWTLGQGQYRGGTLRLYRSFSPFPVPALTLDRTRLVLSSRRAPVGAEPDLLPVGAVIVRCTHGARTLELALSEHSLTGLRSWVESRPPGSPTSHRRSLGDARSG